MSRLPEVAFDIHTRMQHTHNQNACLLRGVDDVGSILVASELRCKLCGASSDAGSVGEYPKVLVLHEQIGPCLLKPEVQDCVLVDTIEVGDLFFGQTVGHFEKYGFRQRHI